MEFEVTIKYKIENTNIKEALKEWELYTEPEKVLAKGNIKYKVEGDNQIVEWSE
jgi:hypothetical protein